MSQEHVDALRSAYKQFARGDFSAYSELPDDFELVLAPEMPDAGSYRGDAARRWLSSWVGSFDRLTVEAVEFIDAGDRDAGEQSGGRAASARLSRGQRRRCRTVHVGCVHRTRGCRRAIGAVPQSGRGPRSRGAVGVGEIAAIRRRAEASPVPGPLLPSMRRNSLDPAVP